MTGIQLPADMVEAAARALADEDFADLFSEECRPGPLWGEYRDRYRRRATEVLAAALASCRVSEQWGWCSNTDPDSPNHRVAWFRYSTVSDCGDGDGRVQAETWRSASGGVVRRRLVIVSPGEAMPPDGADRDVMGLQDFGAAERNTPGGES